MGDLAHAFFPEACRLPIIRIVLAELRLLQRLEESKRGLRNVKPLRNGRRMACINTTSSRLVQTSNLAPESFVRSAERDKGPIKVGEIAAGGVERQGVPRTSDL
jgi:hypothetical protein